MVGPGHPPIPACPPDCQYRGNPAKKEHVTTGFRDGHAREYSRNNPSPCSTTENDDRGAIGFSNPLRSIANSEGEKPEDPVSRLGELPRIRRQGIEEPGIDWVRIAGKAVRLEVESHLAEQVELSAHVEQAPAEASSG